MQLTRTMPYTTSRRRAEATPRLVQDQALNEALLAPGATAPTLVRLEGTGRVLMEQSP